MISEETVWQEIWPVVEGLVQATLAEDGDAAGRLLAPGSEAAEIFDLFGVTVFDILLKTVLGRGRLAVTRAVETEEERYVHIEFVWPDADVAEHGYTAADLVAVTLARPAEGQAWQVVKVNPAAIEFPLTEARAHGILVTSKAFNKAGQVPAEPWLLPVAFFGGSLQIPLRPEAMQDEVERLFLPGLQHRAYGVASLVAGRRLWREFKQKGRPAPGAAAAWAAAVEMIMSEQTLREATQAAVAGHYQVSLGALVPRVKQVKKALAIQGLDGRYSPLSSTHIVLKEEE